LKDDEKKVEVRATTQIAGRYLLKSLARGKRTPVKTPNSPNDPERGEKRACGRTPGGKRCVFEDEKRTRGG